ncbi:hypothetical protein [Actinoplanes sp. TFC3]|uniref:hypothetical protein n=1 Tax=Actinoplanes sp. TFC3 TaxID=1710355 RepID=UPI00083689FF|nr:hypothetical protein [Actinoplanes sp. TFC3]
MQSSEVLDVFEKLLNAAQHPGIAKVERYDGVVSGIRVRFSWETDGFLWVKADAPAPTAGPEPTGEKFGTAPYLIKLALDLCESARPGGFASWVPATYKGMPVAPSGLQIKTTDGGTVNLRVTSGGQDPEVNPHAGYSVPAGIIV